MNPKKRTKDDDFKSVARELGCDEDKERFERQLRAVARAKPPVKKAPKPKRKAKAKTARK